MRSSFSVSPSSRRPAGMPVQLAMTSAMSSAVTSSETIGASPPAFEDVASAACASSSCFSRAGMSP